MLRNLLFAAMLTALVQALANDALANDIKPRLTEAQVWNLSNRQYEMLLDGARQRGWTFPADQIKHGYIRHHEEFRLRLLNEGYGIVSDTAGL